MRSGPTRPPVVIALEVAGAAALGLAAWIHLHLWALGYRHVATIGTLFLMQAVAATALALVLLVTRHLAVAAAGAAFLVATASGLLLSNWVGLFGFHDHLDAPYAGMSLVVEGGGAVVLAGAVLWHRRRR